MFVSAGSSSAPWVIVASGFHRRGGMEKANRAVAEHLANRGTEVHLVGHQIDQDVAAHPQVRAYPVPRRFGSDLLGQGRLDRQGRWVARQVLARHPDARVMVNGGNCAWGDINWVHCVHHAWRSATHPAPLWFRGKRAILQASARNAERLIIPTARHVIANSFATRRQLIDILGIPEDRISTLYLGCDEDAQPPTPEERAEARRQLGLAADIPLVAFIGALGYDANKGFDTLLAAWSALAGGGGWDGMLIAAGGGRGLEMWRERVSRLGLDPSVRLLGFTTRVDQLLAAADLLVSPVRYEAYGLNVQEALCRDVPAIVSRSAGIAERFSGDLPDLLLNQLENPHELVSLLSAWRSDISGWRARVRPLGAELRRRRWSDMAHDLVATVEGEPSGHAGRTARTQGREPSANTPGFPSQ